MTRKGLLTIFGAIALSGFLVHCGQEDTAFTSQDASSFAGKVAGRVVDKNGSAVNGALVTLRPGGTTTVSGDSGKYEFGSVTPGKYRVEFTKADYRDTARPDSTKVGLLQVDSLGASQLHYRYATVKGNVTDSAGAAFATASIAVENQEASASVMEGSFTLRKVEPGTVRLFAAYQGVGYGTKDVTLSAGDTDSVVVKIDHKGGTVTGTVTTASGTTVKGATVTAAGGGLTTTTDDSGNFTLKNVPSTTMVVVDGGSQGKTSVSGVTVSEGGRTSLSVVSVSLVTRGTMPTVLSGLAVGVTTDSVVVLQARDSAGTDTAWHVLRHQWSFDNGTSWADSSAYWRLHPAVLGWSTTAGSHKVLVRAKVYRIMDAVVQDSVTASGTITVRFSLPPDTIPPTLARVSPVADTVAWDDSVATVSWKVSDDRKLDTVWLDGAVATVNGGVVSKTDTLAVGATTVQVMARDSSGNKVQDSVVLVRKVKPDTLTTLSALVMDTTVGKLTPNFASDTLRYRDTVAAGTTKFVLTPTASSASDTIKVNGVVVKSGSPDTVTLNADTATVKIVVSSPNTITTHTYTVSVVRKAATLVGSGTFTDIRDGQVYKYVTIGSQVWMAQNLNYDTLNGTGSWCYNDSSKYCSTYGRLYSWATVMKLDTSYNRKRWGGSDRVHRQGICPSGWRVPTDTEWGALIAYVGSDSARIRLSSKSGWDTGNGTDKFGFGMLPANYRNIDGSFEKGIYSSSVFRTYGSFSNQWSSSESDTAHVWYRSFGDLYVNVLRFGGPDNGVKTFGFSLRCIEGAGTDVSSDTFTTLSKLVVDTAVGKLSPSFDSSVMSYKDTVVAGTTKFVLTPTASSASDTIKVNGMVVKSGTSDTVTLSADTTTVKIVVSSPNTATTHTYTVSVVRKVSSSGASASGTFTDARDGQIYKYVTIGTQTWMAQNLNYRKSAGSTDTVGVCYNYADSNCTTYGRLYTWAEAMGLASMYNGKTWAGSDVKHQGLCPTGWHVPSDVEWRILEVSVGMDSATAATTGWRGTTEGTKLKANSSLWSTNAGTDTYGFSVLPGGYDIYSGSFLNLGSYAYFWSASEYDATRAWHRNFGNGFVLRYGDDPEGYDDKVGGFSLRCIEGSGTSTPADTLTTLHSLALDSGTLTTTFDSSVTGYVDSVASTVTSLNVTATASSTSDTVKVNGTAVTSGTATSVNVSTDTTITIIVSNPNTTSTKTYTVRVVHGASFTETTRILSTYPTVTMDSASTRTVYGIKAFANPASSVSLSVPGGYVEMQATLAADSTATFSANAMIDHGLDSLGGEHDLTGLDSITFEFRNSAAIGDYFSIALGSGAYSVAITNAGQEYEWVLSNAATRSASATTWKSASLSASNLVIPSWVTSVPAEYPSLANVLKRINFIKFFPKTSYDSSNVIPVTTSQTLDVRNISLHFTGR